MPRQPSFDIDTVETGNTLRIVVAGELDIATAPLLEAALEAAEARDVERILVDLEAVPFIDSSGLKALLRAVDRSAADSCRLSIARSGPQARQLFELSGALSRLPLAD
jgi:anti-sigma B factor antagonist